MRPTLADETMLTSLCLMIAVGRGLQFRDRDSFMYQSLTADHASRGRQRYILKCGECSTISTDWLMSGFVPTSKL